MVAEKEKQQFNKKARKPYEKYDRSDGKKKRFEKSPREEEVVTEEMEAWRAEVSVA